MIGLGARKQFLLAFAVSLSACASTPDVKAPLASVERAPVTVNAASATGTVSAAAAPANGIAGQIKGLVEQGTPPSLLRALDLIRSRELGSTEFGRAMTATVVVLMQKLYPELRGDLPVPDPPPTHLYTKILKDAERGAYTPASTESVDYLELVLPFLALLNETRSERLAAALPDLDRAAQLNTLSSLEPYFRGIIAERQGQMAVALAAYDVARSRSADCYPAAIAAARLMADMGKAAESVSLLGEIAIRYPDNESVKRALAKAYYATRDWSRAGTAIAEILQLNPRDVEFMLMRAHALVAQGSYLQAQPLLDAIATIDATNRLYLYLRAMVQAEGYRNRDSALTYLRAILRVDPNDEEALSYAARLLLESSRPEEIEEGRAFLELLLSASQPSLEIIELALKDKLARAAWLEALPLVELLLAERRSIADIRAAVAVYVGLGDAENALDMAGELYGVDNPADDDTVLYVNALIGAGRGTEALKIIEDCLQRLPSGAQKSKLYYARSRLKTDEEAVISDLRSSLFEDPRNLDSLIAMLELYRARKDDRRAVYYLKQALAIAPDNPLLRTYKTEYAALMN